MSFLRPIQLYHSHADPIWPDGTFNQMFPSVKLRQAKIKSSTKFILFLCRSAKVYVIVHGLQAVFSKGHTRGQRLFFLFEQKTKT